MSNSRVFRLSPLAEADLEEIWLYTLRQWSIKQADAYHRNIIAAIADLACGRVIGQQTDIREGYWKFKSGMDIIYYRESCDHLDVIRMLHGRMDVELQLEENE